MPIQLIHDNNEHASHSGYGQLAKYVDTKISGSGLSIVQRIRSLFGTKTLVHQFDGADVPRLAAIQRKRFNKKIVATFHQTPEHIEANVADKSHIRELAAAFVVSEYQIPYLARHVPYDRVFHVPQGVDTKFWCPDVAVAKSERPSFLYVATEWCNVGMFWETVRALKAAGVDACFRVVVSAARNHQFRGLPDTEVLVDLDEAARLREYRTAHALFLPLDQGTSNDAVLEAMSCGTPIVTTRVGGIPEYLDERCAIVVPPGGVADAVVALRRIAGDRSLVQRMGTAARRRAETFAWEVIGERTNYIYHRILGSNCTRFFHQHEAAPRNICLLTEEYPPETGWGGIATYGYNLAQGLAQAGHHVVVISGCVDRPSITKLDCIEVHCVKFQPKDGWKKRFWERRVVPRLQRYPELRRRIEFALAARKRFRYLFDRLPIHLIESPEYFGSVYAIQWLRKRCPTMIKLHTPSEVNCWVNDVPVSKDIKLSNILEKGSTKRADKVTAPSRKIIDIVTKRWLPGKTGIELLEYPIDTDIYSPGPGRVTTRKHFLFTGRLEHRKGVHLLVEAFARVANEIPDYDLHFAGHDTPTFARDGKTGLRFMEWLEGADIAPEIRKRMEFLGRIPLRDLIPLYRGAFACIIPSTSFENFPNSCLEAIACGKAVIVSDAGGMVEMVSHMESGIHVKANDVDSLAAAIRHLAQHPEETARFGVRAREIVLERYAKDKIVARTMKVFDGVINNGRYR